MDSEKKRRQKPYENVIKIESLRYVWGTEHDYI